MGSKISNTEWGLVIGALLVIDGVQLLLDFLLIGPFFNGYIDLAVGMTFPIYMRLRGVTLDSKKVGGMVGTFLFEIIPGFDALPLWCLDGALNCWLDNKDKKKRKTEAQTAQNNQQQTEPLKKAA